MQSTSIRTHTFGDSSFAATKDGRRLHYMSKGAGPVTVVFESGMGSSRSTWGLVAPAVSAHARTVVYDRAGLGQSDPDTASRTLARLGEDLGTLLRELGDGPFILVGHSWGGPIVRVTAASSSEAVAGLVLVDPSDENCELYFKASTARWFGVSRVLYRIMAKTGLYRALGSKPGSVQPADVAADHRREDFTVQAANAMAAESIPFLTELAGLRKHAPALGTMKVALISGTMPSRSGQKIRVALTAAHRQSVAALANARYVEAPRSEHMIMFTEPELIAAEIIGMVKSIEDTSLY